MCIRCEQRPPVVQKRRCKVCLAEMESQRRARQLENGEALPCATEDCEAPRYRLPSQWSAYCHEHHLLARRRTFYRASYGLTIEEYEGLMARASHACQVCGSKRRLVVDHCHQTGAVRGILCTECNVSLGNLHEDVDRLLALAAYLMTSRDVLAGTGGRDVSDDVPMEQEG